jgi:chromosome segregation ATPase
MEKYTLIILTIFFCFACSPNVEKFGGNSNQNPQQVLDSLQGKLRQFEYKLAEANGALQTTEDVIPIQENKLEEAKRMHLFRTQREKENDINNVLQEINALNVSIENIKLSIRSFNDSISELRGQIEGLKSEVQQNK